MKLPCLTSMSALGHTGERQEHLDAIVSFAGIDILTIKWATGHLPEECRFLLNTQLIFLTKEKDPTSMKFDDDEWIRSLTEAQEVTADVPEDSVIYDQQEVDSRKSSVHSDGRVLAEVCLAATFGAQRRRTCRPHDSNAAARRWVSGWR